MGQVIFVVWRECFEALLVVGIIYSWIKHNPESRNGMPYLYGGIGLGVLISIILALIINGIFKELSDDHQTIFMMGMSVLACMLIVQMVYWMNKHARSMKSSLEKEMAQQVARHSWWGALFIIAIAIAREGSEIVVFLSGQIMQLNSHNYAGFCIAVLIGIAVSALTFYAFILTSRFIQWKKFFTITGIILLFLAISLLMRAVEDGTNMLLEHDISIPDFLISPAWDTSYLIDDSGLIGSFTSSLFAYRSQPMWISVITFGVFWLLMAILFLRKKSK
ncbi:MAG: FTR1 family protein [Snodgrassella sp.]|uniref:FTR1 family iron permease n=1 Tax=Snodgrassella TaxID=1193515 RepID=UPI000815B8FC|nr:MULTISPECIES: FTR1 family protein [Snodgrassella]MCO6508597.1 FTR1 family protein [Snodgrassella sp.]MCO6513147.1 FTR1 family protein [Snodgrassella sp.]MCO6518767.1 FTR1 family protein [Snodgrassella sp.]MCO6519464.1 FTR1 family protein [Snodgrassella sp.]SCB94809.1 high-affinity iron transporter [Snodgrassella sp. R-53583]